MGSLPAVSFRLVAMVHLFFVLSSPLHPPGFGAVNVCGIVSLPDGQPAPRITVTISSQNGFNATTITNDQGSYCFEGLPAAIFSLGIIPRQDSKYRAEPVPLDATHYGPSFTVNIFMTNPLEASLPKERTANAISAREAGQHIPKDARKALERGQKYKEGRRFDAALAEFDKATKIFPDYFQAFTEKGIVQIQSGHPEKALPEFEKAIRIVPEYAPALSGAGYCLLTSEKFDQAAAFLEKAVQLDSTNAQSFLFLGIATVALSRWQRAQQALESALKIDPTGAVSAHIYLGDALAGQRLYGLAADELRTYLQLNPQAPNADRLRRREANWRDLAKGVVKASPH